MPRKPSDAISAISSRGILPCSSISCARGSTFSRANLRAVRCASSCSGESARSKPSSLSVFVVVTMPMLLVRIEGYVPAIGVASEEVVAAELSDDRAGGLRASEYRTDVVHPEPHDEAALRADLGLGLAITGFMHDELRIRGVEPSGVATALAGQADHVAIEARHLSLLRAECEHRADHRALDVRQRSSTASATASPPPRHSDATPRLMPRARSA